MSHLVDNWLRHAKSAHVLRCVVVCALIAATLQTVAAQDGDADAASFSGAREGSFDDRLESAFAELERSRLSAIVAVSHDGGPVSVREFGALDDDGLSGRTTQIDLNSVTKTVTGVMILKLVDQRKVGLEEPLNEIFLDVPDDKAGITVHHLLTHSAGFVESVGDDGERLGKQDFLRRAFATQLLSMPGARYNYSNVGYSILAAIIEERSGKSFDAYLQHDVLSESGIDDTGYMSVYDESRSLRDSDGGSVMETSWGGHEPYWNLIGNGGLVSTVEDFIRFRQAVIEGNIVPRGLVEQSQAKHVPEDADETSFYGYGLVVQDLPEVGRFYWHDGGNDVFSTMWADFADQGDVVFIAAVDTPGGDAVSAMTTVVEHLYGGGAG